MAIRDLRRARKTAGKSTEAESVDGHEPRAGNIISPMGAYFPFILAYAQRYDTRSGIGTLMASMILYSTTFFLVWTAFPLVRFLSGLPLGPGAGLYYAPATH